MSGKFPGIPKAVYFYLINFSFLNILTIDLPFGMLWKSFSVIPFISSIHTRYTPMARTMVTRVDIVFPKTISNSL